ncbi:MAG: DNA methyltransferase [Dehalococcoidia bacterium]
MDTNVLYYGDNLDVLRKHIPDESIDLIYLDPPFNSKRDYNIIFREAGGEEPEAQIKAFGDTWRWDRAAEQAYQEIGRTAPGRVVDIVRAMRSGIGDGDVTAYLVMMTIRLLEFHRALKHTGSMFLHCDPTASHYLKLVLDQIFGPGNFQNEIVWHYRGGGVSPRRFARRHDIVLFYAKGSEWTFNIDPVREPYSEDTLERTKYKARSFRGDKVYEAWEPNPLGKHPDDVWDLQPIMPSSKERLSYPTQKPLALLERIVLAGSNEGDILLDPFCGCGTAVIAAEKLNRQWIGIDITHLAITVMKKRLRDSFSSIAFDVVGEPADLESARALASEDRYQFQWWALSLVAAKPVGDTGKRGADRGIDGVIDLPEEKGALVRVIVSVKSGHVSVTQIRDLKGVLEREKAAMGLFVTLEAPTGPMKREAAGAGFYHSGLWQKDYPKLQILTVEALLGGEAPDLPPFVLPAYNDAGKVSKGKTRQIRLGEALVEYEGAEVSP